MPLGLVGSYATSRIKATADSVFTVYKNTVNIGSITFKANSSTGIISSPLDMVLNPGDVLCVAAPASLDSTLADIGFSFHLWVSKDLFGIVQQSANAYLTGSLSMSIGAAGAGGAAGAYASAAGSAGGNTTVTYNSTTITGGGGQPGSGGTYSGGDGGANGGYTGASYGNAAAAIGNVAGGNPTAAQSADVSGLQAAVVAAGASWTGPGGQGSPGGAATGFGCGGGDSALYSGYGAAGGNGLYGGGGGSACFGYGGGSGGGGNGGGGAVVCQFTQSTGTTYVILSGATTSYNIPAYTTGMKIWAVGGGNGGSASNQITPAAPGGAGGVAYKSWP